MKIIVILLVSFVAIATCEAQNTFPAYGNVGIGTTSPQQQLHISGTSPQFLIRSTGTGLRGLWMRVDDTVGATIFDSSYNTAGAYPITFRLGGIEYVRFDTNGYVGLGAANPAAHLEVRGSNGNSGSGGDIYANAENSYIGVDASQSRMGLVKQWGNYPVIGADNASPIIFGNFATTGLLATISSTTAFAERMRITQIGNVGIGTANPVTLLHLARPSQCQIILENTDGTYDASIGYKTPARTWYIGQNCVNPSTGCFNVFDGTAWATRFLIDTAGNVGIGTTNPTEKLSVKGRIRAQEVVVDNNNWSDYVFADDYKLQSLSDVEAHIKTNKHLPGVPSAQDVSEKGVSLGDMQSILLAKIEELTLHQIEQEKAIAWLNRENAKLQVRIIELENR